MGLLENYVPYRAVGVLAARAARSQDDVVSTMKVLAEDRAFPDSAIRRIDGIVLTREWQRYRIPLNRLDLSSIKTGFVVTLTGRSTPVTIYLDSIRYIRK